MNKTTYWLDWKKKIIQPSSPGLNSIPWAEVEKYPLTIYCDQNTWPYIEIEKHTALTPEQVKLFTTNEEKRTYQIGLATIKEIRGGTQENPEGLGSQSLRLLHKLVPEFATNHPRTGEDFFQISNYWKFAPRFENLQQGIFSNVWKIDIKSCYANIMRDYPLPCGEPEHLTDPELIEQNLQQGKEGFISFKITAGMIPRHNQIPFLPNYHNEIKKRVQGRFFCYTKLFRAFCRQYVKRRKIIFAGLWIFTHQKGCVDPFLNHCEELKKQEPKKGKMLTNALYGILGKNSFNGYHYHPFMLAVNHLAILKTYYLYRQFKPKQVLAIRSDCIYVQGELPGTLNKELYHLEKYDYVGLQGEENIYVFDTQTLKARPINSAEEREKLMRWFEEQK